MKGIANRLKKLEAVRGQVNEIQIVDKFLDMITQAAFSDPIPELPDYFEFREMQIDKGR